MEQHEREMCVGALLDITVGEWDAWVKSPTTDVDSIDEQVNMLLATMIAALHGMEGEFSPQIYIQQIALMSDATLKWTLEQLKHYPL